MSNPPHELPDPDDEQALSVDSATSELQIESKPVEFFVLAPNEVPPGATFPINIHIANLSDSDLALEQEQTDDNFQTLITQITDGSRLGLVLQALPPPNMPSATNLKIQIDTPYQALTWSGRNLVATFNVQAPQSADPVTLQSRLWITIRSIDIGTIDVEIHLNPKIKLSSESKEHYRSDNAPTMYPSDLRLQWKLSQLSGVGRRASLFKTAFICYAHADKKLVDVFHDVIEAALSKCHKDDLDMLRDPHWLEQVADWIDAVDVVYIMWSEAAARRPSIVEELEVICAQRRLRLDRATRPTGAQMGKPTKLTICVALLGGDMNELPECIAVDCGYTRRPQSLRRQNA